MFEGLSAGFATGLSTLGLSLPVCVADEGRFTDGLVVTGRFVVTGRVAVEGLRFVLVVGRVAVAGLRFVLVAGRAVDLGLLWVERLTCDDGLAADDLFEDDRLTEVPDDLCGEVRVVLVLLDELFDVDDDLDVDVEREVLWVCANASDWKAVNARIASIAANVVLIFPIIVLF